MHPAGALTPPAPSAATAIATICWASTSKRCAHDGPLDQAFAHAPRDDRALQAAPELREDPPDALLPHAVAGAPDLLQAGRPIRRLDLQHQIDGAHVDPELEELVATRHGSRPAFSSLDLRALARQRAVMGAGDLGARLAGRVMVSPVAASRPGAPPARRPGGC
jgi:hypothetical protein